MTMTSLLPVRNVASRVAAGSVTVVVLAVLALGWYLLGGGANDDPSRAVLASDSDDGAVLAVDDDEDAEATAVDAVDDDAGEPALPEITYELLLTRDPFEAVRPEPVPDPTDPTAPTDPTDPTAPVDPTDPTRPVDPTQPTDPTRPVDPPISPTDPCQPVDSVHVCEGKTVRVLEADGGRARIQVGDVVYEPSVNDTFATDFVLVEARGDCALIRYDNRQTFRQCLPESTFK